MPEKHEIALWMKEFDSVPRDNRITEEEFLKGMEKWRDSVKLSNTNNSGALPRNYDPEV
jgi:hypothetical protein